jgi:hypothetical protein
MNTHAPLNPFRRTWPLALALLAAGFATGRAAPLAGTAAVQTKPEPGAPIITTLNAGTEPAIAPSPAIPPPDGWIAVQVPGPFQGYVLNKDFTKGLDVKPGSPIYLAPKPDAGVLAIAAKGDKTEITGLDGRWTQVQLQRDLVGYVQLAAPAAVPAAEAGPVLAPVPSAPAAPADAVGKPAEADASATSLSRTFEGQVEATSRTLFVGPKPPFPWQLVDPSGARIAYLDLSQLLLTQQIDQYVGHTVDVFGPASPVGKTGDVVVQVQSLQSK